MNAFTVIHVLFSLAGIISGGIVVFGMLASQRYDAWTRLFLGTTLATSVTGFLFPFHGVTPAHVTGFISLTVLIVAFFARYSRHLLGGWRRVWVISAVISLYLNVFVLIVQMFLKLPALQALAPTPGEPVFIFTQLTVLVLFVALGVAAAFRFRSEPAVLVPETST